MGIGNWMVALKLRDLLIARIGEEAEGAYSSMDIIGEIAVIKVPYGMETHVSEIGGAVMEINRHVKTVYMQTGGIQGDYRLRSLEHIAGEPMTKTIHREYGCRYLVDVERTYFSPRLSEERRFLISSWRRISSDALPPQAKCWANYANSGLAVREAARLGYDGAIFLDSRGFVCEGTAACLATVRDGRLITPPVTASILESITRSAFLEFIPEDLDIPVEVRDITRVELYAADEAFLHGTGGEVTPITSIDGIKIGEEYPGPLTTRIAEHYAEVLAGNIERRRNWLTPV